MNSINSFKEYADQFLGKSDQRRLKELMNKINVARAKRGDPIEEEMASIKIKLTDPNCLPEKKHRWDAGWDLKSANETFTIKVGETVKVHTGAHFEIPPRFFGMVVARSGLGCKHGITLANDVGIIDSEYRGEVMAFLTNNGSEDVEIKQYDRFAQIIMIPINTNKLWLVDHLSETERAEGGYGSTGGHDKLETPKTIVDGSPEMEKAKDNDIIIPAPENLDEHTHEGKEGILVAVLGEDDTGKLVPTPLEKLTPSDYMRLLNSGMFWETYPEATGDMNEDLKLGK